MQNQSEEACNKVNPNDKFHILTGASNGGKSQFLDSLTQLQHGWTVGHRFNQLSQCYNQRQALIQQLRKPCNDHYVSCANQYKASLLNGHFDLYPQQGDKSITIWRNKYDKKMELEFSSVKSVYGLFEDTWIEVKRGNYSLETFKEDAKGDTLYVTINW